jgi:hypothetical protein
VRPHHTWKVQYGNRQMSGAFQEFRQERTLSATDVDDVTKSGAVDWAAWIAARPL